eukprot:g9517.t1
MPVVPVFRLNGMERMESRSSTFRAGEQKWLKNSESIQPFFFSVSSFLIKIRPQYRSHNPCQSSSRIPMRLIAPAHVLAMAVKFGKCPRCNKMNNVDLDLNICVICKMKGDDPLMGRQRRGKGRK